MNIIYKYKILKFIYDAKENSLNIFIELVWR